jgi:hypothetical protein
MVHGYWQEHRQATEHRISQLTGEQTVPLVGDRSNVSESERDGFSDKHPNLAQPHPSPLLGQAEAPASSRRQRLASASEKPRTGFGSSVSRRVGELQEKAGRLQSFEAAAACATRVL